MTRPSTDDLAAALRARAEATHAPDGALADRAIAGGLRRRRRTVAGRPGRGCGLWTRRRERRWWRAVSYTHLTLPTSDLV